MGIFINLAVSHSVSQSEWEAVYREALELAQKLGLADVRRLEIGGVTVRCLSRTQEYTSPSRWLKEDWTGFQICGDYETQQIAETNYVPKNLRPACTICLNYVDGAWATYSMDRGERHLVHSHQSFDLAALEFLGYLSSDQEGEVQLCFCFLKLSTAMLELESLEKA